MINLMRVVLAFVVLFQSLSVHATLIPVFGGQAVYDTDRDLTFLANANLADTETFEVSGVNVNGSMNQSVAVAWVAAMNVDSYLGFSGWRLTDASFPDNTCTSDTAGINPTGDTTGFNCTEGEFGHLFYDELGGTAGEPILDSSDPDVALFSNIVQNNWYWTGTENSNIPGTYFQFAFQTSAGGGNGGNQIATVGGGSFVGYAWPVHDGNIGGAVVPVEVPDVTGVVDISGDAVPDVAHLTTDGQPKVRYYSGASRQKIKGVSYLGPAWSGVAAATVADSNGDGVANDPAVAVLAHKASDGKHVVEVRRADNKALINKVFFLGPSWEVIDVAVIDVITPAALTQPALAVLAVNPDKPFDQQIKVQVRWLSNGALLANWFFLNGNWTPLALEGVNRIGTTPLLAVLANKAATGNNIVQARQFSDGTVQRDTSFLDSSWLARDVAILLDSNGDGNANDPAYLVLANHPETGRNKVQARRVSDGARLKNITMPGTNWKGSRVTGTGDISGNLREEVGVLAEKKTDGTIAIQLKDYEDRSTTATIFP